MSVWVEIQQIRRQIVHLLVTLHVSVWVEIRIALAIAFWFSVTLHVSVWVEMSSACLSFSLSSSRSTWACELKFWRVHVDAYSVESRSTWACELKLLCSAVQVHHQRHAPRERVSWNLNCSKSISLFCVTLHMSVWVEIIDYMSNSEKSDVTLHVSVWVNFRFNAGLINIE